MGIRSTCIVVLGGHRSGTSAVAGVLRHLGVFMGSGFVGSTKYNPRGHWEDVEFLALNKKVVGDWRRPLVDFEPQRKGYAALVKKRQRHNLWGFKDPRMCYVFPYFLTVTTARVKVIDVRRNLRASARSMANRKGKKPKSQITVTLGRAAVIARAYRDAKWLALENFDGPVLRVDYGVLVKDADNVVSEIADFCGVKTTEAAVKFISPKLKHY